MKRKDLLEKFLGSNNISLKDRDIIKKNFELDEVIKDLNIFHQSLKGKKDYSLGLVSEAGKLRLEQKILLLRMERFQKESEIYLGEVIEEAKECIAEIDEESFIGLIDRSYKNSEITLGRVYQNICSSNNSLSISDFSRIKLGMVEDDFIKLIKRAEKRNKDLNYLLMLDEFIERENLDCISRNYIFSILNYPSDIANYISFAYVRGLKDEEVIEGLSSINSSFNIF